MEPPFHLHNLALLLVLWGQVKRELEEREANRKATWTASSTGVPKATDLKWAFTKLWNAYETPLKNYVTAEKKKENMFTVLSLSPFSSMVHAIRTMFREGCGQSASPTARFASMC